MEVHLCGQWLPFPQQWLLQPSRPSFSLKTSLIPLGRTQQQWVPAWFIWHLAYAVWIVFCIFIALSGLPSLTEDTLKSENTMKMETMVFASAGSQLQMLPYTELAYRVMLCRPSKAQPGTMLSIWCSSCISHLELTRTTTSKRSGKGQILSMKRKAQKTY